MVGTAQWWGFWLANLGIAVPLLAFVAIAAGIAARRGQGGARHDRGVPGAAARARARRADHLRRVQPRGLPVVELGQHQAARLLVPRHRAAHRRARRHWWRRVWPRVAAIVLVARCFSPARSWCSGCCRGRRRRTAITGPYTIANTQELQLASTIDRVTPKGAVFLTFGRPNDPVLAVAGRIGVMGYGGWLWSYGISFETRFNDVQTMYTGCAADRGHVPGLRALAQVRHQLRGDRQPADGPGRDRCAGGASAGGRIRDFRSLPAPITSPSTTCAAEADVTGSVTPRASNRRSAPCCPHTTRRR